MLLQRIKNKLRNSAHSFLYNLPQCIYPKEWHIKPTDRFLVLSPHPDDESIGCGGFLLKYGKQCDVVLLTNGCHGDPDIEPVQMAEIRKREFESVMQKVQVSHVDYLDIEDGHLIEHFAVFKHISLKGYNYVLMPGYMDNHSDHRAVSILFHKLVSLRRITGTKTVYYEIWSALSQPTHYVDISDIADKKRELINMYASQTKHIDYASRILALNHYRSISHYTKKIEYEEDFLIV